MHRLPIAFLALALLFPLHVRAADAPLVLPAPADSLVAELEPLTRDRLFRSADVAVQVVDVRTGQEVWSHGADTPLNPASTMKVLTSAAALKALGPSYRFSTEVYTDGQIDGNGVLQGNLYVKGHGDPTFVVEKLWKLVYDLKLEGVERISGDVVYDESFLTTDYTLPGWDKEEDIERGPSYFPKLSALSLNFNTVALVVAPGPQVGSPARVTLETPAGSYVTVDSEVTTGAAGSWRSLDIERELTGHTMRFGLTGSVPLGSDARRYYRSVDEPTSHFAAAFEEMLAAQGVRIDGRHRRAATPVDASLLLAVRSPALAQILMDTNKFSNNFMAEQVLRTLGAEVYGAPGDTAKGLRVVEDYLVSLGIDKSEFTLVNGSGLTRDTFVAPSHLTAVMLDMAHDPRVGHEFAASLAIAGQDGTLWERLTDAPGRLRGKTGTIDGVHCLTGYVEAGDGGLYAFAFLVNDVRGSIAKVKRLHDRFAQEMFQVGASPAGSLEVTVAETPAGEVVEHVEETEP